MVLTLKVVWLFWLFWLLTLLGRHRMLGANMFRPPTASNFTNALCPHFSLPSRLFFHRPLVLFPLRFSRVSERPHQPFQLETHVCPDATRLSGGHLHLTYKAYVNTIRSILDVTGAHMLCRYYKCITRPLMILSPRSEKSILRYLAVL
jgi:hypothetical protein